MVSCLSSSGISCLLFGGWAVDALVGTQTRPHEDVDLVLDPAVFESAVATLVGFGLEVVYDARPQLVKLRAAVGDLRVDLCQRVLDNLLDRSFAIDGGGVVCGHLLDSVVLVPSASSLLYMRYAEVAEAAVPAPSRLTSAVRRAKRAHDVALLERTVFLERRVVGAPSPALS